MIILQKPSPNQDGNRTKIDRIIIHWIVGNIYDADAQFAKPNSTSAHYAIENELIHQYVQENRVAYHAGNYPMNQRSIGIEHSASPDRPASEKTYQTSGQLVYEICKRHNIPLDRQHILKHSEVVPTQCCGTVDIDKIISIAKTYTNSQPPMNNDKRPYYFDLINKVVWNKPHEQLTEADITKFTGEYPSQLSRSGKWDKLCLMAGLTGDSNEVSVDFLYKTIQSKTPNANETEIRRDERSKTLTEVRNIVGSIK